MKPNFAGNNAMLWVRTMDVDNGHCVSDFGGASFASSFRSSSTASLLIVLRAAAVIRNFMDAKCNNFVVKSISLLSIAHDFLFKKPTAVACYRFHTEQTPHLCSYSNLHFVLQPLFTPNMPIAR